MITASDTRPVATRDRWLFGAAGVAVTLFIVIVVGRPWNLHDALMIGTPFGREFANFWIGGVLAIQGKLNLLIDFDGYNELLFQTFHYNPRSLVFSYPPHILLFLAPFGALPHPLAVVLWSAGNLWLVWRAVRLLSDEPGLPWLAVLSPAVLIMVAMGHFGGALAFLSIFILTRSRARPILAGCCLALLTVKPQFAASMGLFLLLIGQWRVLVAGAVATIALVGLSVLVFGIAPWIGFFEWTLPFHAQLLSNYQVGAFRTALSIYTAARMEGVGDGAAKLLQFAFAIPVLAATILLFRRRGPDPRAVTFALLAMLYVLPYFQHYDMAIVAPALTVALFGPSSERPFLSAPAASALWLAPPFALPAGQLALPIVPVIVAIVVVVALVREYWPPRIRRAVAVLHPGPAETAS
jgi:alpha-1,2-mannosyltransferase